MEGDLTMRTNKKQTREYFESLLRLFEDRASMRPMHDETSVELAVLRATEEMLATLKVRLEKRGIDARSGKPRRASERATS